MTEVETPIDPYGDAVRYLYGFINLEHNRIDRYLASKMDTTRSRRLIEHLGSPHEKVPMIHVAGTKGKGSVSAMCAACLRATGLRVGLYTSPHVQEFRERIRILTPNDADGRISEDAFLQKINQIKVAVEHFPGITWFEILTAMAFLHFADEQVDVAVIEVGLGGRLDATNVITPLVSVITSLSLDHTYLLGDTIDKIAFEKGGIIKPGVPAIVAPQDPLAIDTLKQLATERESPLSLIGQNWQFEGVSRQANGNGRLHITQSPDEDFIPTGASFDLALIGKHQLENAAVALAALHIASQYFPALNLDVIQKGLVETNWIGRLQVVHQAEETPMILADCAHNVDSAEKLHQALTQDFDYERLILVFGATADKDYAGMIPFLFPLADQIIATISSHPRAASPSELALSGRDLGYNVRTSPTIADAFQKAWHLATPSDLICVTGSIFVVGDLLNTWDEMKEKFLDSKLSVMKRV